MKHRVREAIFNLIGPRVNEMHAIDLFAGTGALGLEAGFFFALTCAGLFRRTWPSG